MIVASGTAQRRLLEETILNYEKKGYPMTSRQEGGEWVPLLSENMSCGLFEENSLVVVDSAVQMGAMPENLLPMIDKDSSVIILLVYDTDPSKLFPKGSMSNFTILKPDEYPRWPRERQKWVSDLAKSMGIKIDFNAVALIVELLDDPEEIRGQLKALSLFKRTGTVTMQDVDSFCLDDGSKDLLKILDGLCSCDYKGVMKSFYSISRNGELMPLISAIHNRMRLAMYNATNPRCAAMYAKALGAKDYAWRMASLATKNYPSDSITDFSLGLICMNIAEKTGKSAGWNGLETLLITFLSSKKN